MLQNRNLQTNDSKSMKVKSVLRLLCLVLWTVDVGAASISATQAQTVAQQFLLTHASSMRAPSHGGTTLSLAHEAMSANGETDFFVFNRGVDGGYVIVAGDDSVLPVWAYVDRGAFVLPLGQHIEDRDRQYPEHTSHKEIRSVDKR